LIVVLVGGCSLYLGDPPTPPPPPGQPQPPDVPPTVGGTPPAPYARLAVGPRDVMDVAIDGDYVYWLANHQSQNTSDVFRVAKTGGPSELVAHVDGRVYSFALDDTYVYLPVYVQSDAGGPFLRVPKAGGAFEVLDDHLRYLAFVAVQGDAVYLAALVDEPSVDYQLWRYSSLAGPHTVLVDGLRGPESLAFRSSDVYVTTAGDSLLHQAPADGGPANEPSPSLYALHVQSDGDRVYFLSGAIGECPNSRISAWRPGTTALTDLGAVGSCAPDLAVSSRGVLVLDAASHAVVEFALDGSGAHTVVNGLTSPSAIATEPDGSSIYWGDFETGEIDRLDR
jgi:hypothetical protein